MGNNQPAASKSSVLRQQAHDEAELMRQNCNKANSLIAYFMGWKEYYLKEARQHQEKMNDYNNQADNEVLAESTNGRSVLDLHGMRLHEAIEAVSERLRQLGQLDKLKIITGRGLHSPDGIAILKPAIDEYLRDRGYRVEHDRHNPGLVIASW